MEVRRWDVGWRGRSYPVYQVACLVPVFQNAAFTERVFSNAIARNAVRTEQWLVQLRRAFLVSFLSIHSWRLRNLAISCIESGRRRSRHLHKSKLKWALVRASECGTIPYLPDLGIWGGLQIHTLRYTRLV